MGKLKDANKKIEEKVVEGYKTVENAVVDGYKKVENKFVDKFLRKDGETVEEAKERMKKEQEELEEERRMYYVAMTRAKQYLYVFSILYLHGKTIEASRFLGEMALGGEKIETGTKVIHKKFGKGTVIAQEKGQIRIYFETLKAERLLQLDICKKNNLLQIL